MKLKRKDYERHIAEAFRTGRTFGQRDVLDAIGKVVPDAVAPVHFDMTDTITMLPGDSLVVRQADLIWDQFARTILVRALNWERRKP